MDKTLLSYRRSARQEKVAVNICKLTRKSGSYDQQARRKVSRFRIGMQRFSISRTVI